MRYLVVLNLGNGDWQQGLPTVIAQLWDEDSPNPMQFTGSLPAAPELEALYQRWQTLYEALYASKGWRSSTRSLTFEVDEDDLTHISQTEFHQLCEDLQTALNQWLNMETFRHIDRQLRTQLKPADHIRFIIVADDATLLRLPWCLWSFLDDYPNAEIALSVPEYLRSTKAVATKPRFKVRILAILGNHEGIDIARDRQVLQQLPNAEIKFLVEPNASVLNEQLWEPGWDILFFAGHSSSQGNRQQQGAGSIAVNATESLTIGQLKFALRTAIAHGLKLAIFNSCDGLGLARDLADLHLPQVIVMREPVPDRVAQEFLKHFLTAFAGGASLYTAMREAREKLQALETDFPCATWLPVICQNPAEVPPTWQDWCGARSSPLRLPTRQELRTVLLSSLVVTGLVAGARLLGWLQPLELWSFDRLMQSRPAEPPDVRLLAITITEQDIQAEGEKMRRGSISDRTLNQLLKKLEQHQPAAIGLDLYRDAPTDVPELATRLKQNHLFAVCKRPAAKSDPIGVLPPPEVPESHLGFSDFVRDADGVVRRHLLVLPSNPSSRCTAAYAFSVQLANHYLEAQGIQAKVTPQNDLQFGNTVFRQLQSRTGAYQALVANSGQVLLNYRAAPSPREIVQQATLAQVLTNQINPNAINGRIVLIGIAAPHSSGDYWTTPFGKADTDRVPGVLIHAQMISQILSAVLDQRPLLWVWSTWVETIWLAGWALMGSALAWQFRRLEFLILTVGMAIGILIVLCQICLIQGGWIPLAPPIIALLMTSTAVALLTATLVKPELSHD
ncbi:CHASE2 domain-containing protein [Leptolyngbya sp. FACHB-321]|uniref:CHASE2 domain-containing protein n=1 Tax=Leptolyngbya sp. FACHB-321 TaxID=2692807 RepID=UPI00168541EE|nr:CHASE2 domain-containing protein [Leptolyngbya sp. FACHB-321]MBD2037011.1 CHASE2 domain-containing protein [Leptolyngbya sp. FACHB-321]